jgi:FKBP-type peptidyl-prolyl cis-trans isomerase FkpA
MKNYYEILGVAQTSDAETITAAFKALMQKLDSGAHSATAAKGNTKEFNDVYAVLKAHEVLIDPDARREYDASLAKAKPQDAPPPTPKIPVVNVETGRSSVANKIVQVGLNIVGDVARQTTRRAIFKVLATLAFALGAAVLLLTSTGKFVSNTGHNPSNQKSSGDVVTTPSGLRYKIIKTGEGPTPTDNDVVLVSYEGMLKDGTIFDQNPQAGIPVTGAISGFAEGLKIMQRGGKYRLWIPAELGYGSEDQRNPQTDQVIIPGDSELTFDVELLDFKSRAEVEAIQKEMQKGNIGSDE